MLIKRCGVAGPGGSGPLSLGVPGPGHTTREDWRDRGAPGGAGIALAHSWGLGTPGRTAAASRMPQSLRPHPRGQIRVSRRTVCDRLGVSGGELRQHLGANGWRRLVRDRLVAIVVTQQYLIGELSILLSSVAAVA